MKIRTIICDDNEKARYIIKQYILKLNMPEIEIIAEASDGMDLIEHFERLNPDLVLLDIDMPIINGIETAKRIYKRNPKISFIFITAFHNFSLDAFDVHAVDYILKPLSMERLSNSLEYIISNKNSTNYVVTDKIITLTSNYEQYNIRQSDIIFAEKVDRKCLIHTHGIIYEVYESLGNIQEKLDQDIFIRSHNSYIINIAHISKVTKKFAGSHIVYFKNYDKHAFLSRRNLSKLGEMSNY